MRIKDLLDALKEEDPELLSRMNNKDVDRLVRNVFGILARMVEGLDDSDLKVPGLGSFRYVMINKKSGDEIASVKRVIFKPLKKS